MVISIYEVIEVDSTDNKIWCYKNQKLVYGYPKVNRGSQPETPNYYLSDHGIGFEGRSTEDTILLFGVKFYFFNF